MVLAPGVRVEEMVMARSFPRMPGPIGLPWTQHRTSSGEQGPICLHFRPDMPLRLGSRLNGKEGA